MSNFWGAHHRVRGWTRLSEATADRYAAPWRTKGDAFPEIVAAGAAALVTGLYLGYVKPVDDGACFRQGVDAAQAATAGGRVHPRTRAGGGARKIRVPLTRDEGDCGRGRSERSERSSAGGWLPGGSEPWPQDKKRGWLSVSRLFSQPLSLPLLSLCVHFLYKMIIFAIYTQIN